MLLYQIYVTILNQNMIQLLHKLKVCYKVNYASKFYLSSKIPVSPLDINQIASNLEFGY